MNSNSQEFWFPGSWLGGISLILAPPLLLAGVLLRIQVHFFFPEQLEAYEVHPLLMKWSYQLFLGGNILLWPGIMALVHHIGQSKSALATWGGVMVIFGLFARTFHAGVDHLAFQLVEIHSVEMAVSTVRKSYGAFHVALMFNLFILLGWIVLALGAYLSGTLDIFRSIALAMMSLLMLGVLKGSSIVSVVATTGLCIALVPFGLKVLQKTYQPTFGTVVRWISYIIALFILLYFLAQAG